MKKSLTGRLARRCARRPWRVLGVWALALVAAFGISGALLESALTVEGTFPGNPESKRADDLLDERFARPEVTDEIVIVTSRRFTVEDVAFRREVESVFKDVKELGSEVVGQATNYYASGDGSLVSADRHTTIIPVQMVGSIEDVSDNIEEVLSVVEAADRSERFKVLIVGVVSVGNDFGTVAEEDLQTAETIGLGVAFLVLLLVLGTVVAAAIPVILAIFSILVAIGLTALVGQGFQLSFFAVNMLVMMGLATGIDYGLFVISRFRDERKRGLDKLDAIEVAGSTASRSVFFSGTTVALAMFGMLIVPTFIFRSLATGAILVVVVAILSALTLLPALLGLFGDRVNSLRIPFVGRRLIDAPADSERGFWGWVARGVMRRPVISLVLSAGVLMAAAAPLLNMNTGSAGPLTLPDELPSKQGYVLLDREFSAGKVIPVDIVIDGDVKSGQVQAATRRLEGSMPESRFGVGELRVNDEGNTGWLSVPLASGTTDGQAAQAVRDLRSDLVPRAFDGVPAEVLVGGEPANTVDFTDIATRYLPIVFAIVLALSFILLTVAFRSIVVSLTSIAMNLLSVGAAYGILVLVTQEGVGANLLGLQQVEAVEDWVPLFLFAVLFGLSMDYQVFLVSRIRERYERTEDSIDAVRFAVGSTARIITGAALIMVAVFAGFAVGDLVMFQQMGFGLAVAIIIDATIVRSVLVPSVMRLLGKRNWYMPRALRWLPGGGEET